MIDIQFQTKKHGILKKNIFTGVANLTLSVKSLQGNVKNSIEYDKCAAQDCAGLQFTAILVVLTNIVS